MALKDDATESEGAAAEVSLNMIPQADTGNGYTAQVYTLGKSWTNPTCTSFGDKAMSQTLFHDSIRGWTIRRMKRNMMGLGRHDYESQIARKIYA